MAGVELSIEALQAVHDQAEARSADAQVAYDRAKAEYDLAKADASSARANVVEAVRAKRVRQLLDKAQAREATILRKRRFSEYACHSNFTCIVCMQVRVNMKAMKAMFEADTVPGRSRCAVCTRGYTIATNRFWDKDACGVRGCTRPGRDEYDGYCQPAHSTSPAARNYSAFREAHDRMCLHNPAEEDVTPAEKETTEAGDDTTEEDMVPKAPPLASAAVAGQAEM